MKKIFLIFAVLLTLFLTGCSSEKGDTMNKTKNTDNKIVQSSDGVETSFGEIIIDSKKISYEEGVYPWEEIDIPVEHSCIEGKDTAVKIALTIVEGLQGKGYFDNYEPQTVFYDTKDKIWIVSFWENNDIDTVGSTFSIAMKSQDAQVVKMWVGE